MRVRPRVAALCFATLSASPLLLLSLARPPAAVAAPAVVGRIEALNRKALAAHQAGDSEAAKSLLLEAVVLAKEKGLGTHAAVAQSYRHLGVVLIDGLQDPDRGERFFTLALRIDSDLPPLQAKEGSEAAARAFERARQQAAAVREEEPAADKQAAARPPSEPATAAGEARPSGAGEARTTRMALARELEAKQREQKTQAERDRLAREVEQAEERVSKERQEKQRLLAERELLQADSKRSTGELARLQAESTRLQADNQRLTAEKDRLLKEKQELEKQLAETRAREKKEREDKQRLAEEKQQQEKRLAEEKQQREKRLAEEKQQQEKRLAEEKRQQEKRLAEALEREKKERTAKEKLEEDNRLRLAREAEEKARLKRDRQAAEQLAAGPELPASIPERLHCSAPDASPPGVDLYIHCVPQGQVKAEEITLFYRPSGSARYHSMAMERSRKGWHTAMIPAALVKGTMLQYYAEAHTAKGRTAAANGKPTSPNVVSVNRWPSPVAESRPPDGELLPAAARSGARGRRR